MTSAPADNAWRGGLAISFSRRYLGCFFFPIRPFGTAFASEFQSFGESEAVRSIQTDGLPRSTKGEPGHDDQAQNRQGVEALDEQDASSYEGQDDCSLVSRGRGGSSLDAP